MCWFSQSLTAGGAKDAETRWSKLDDLVYVECIDSYPTAVREISEDRSL
jgi:hypothetical protein